MDQHPLLGRIGVPTLVIGGTLDAATPWEGHGDLLTASIPGARAVVLEAAHLSNVELPSAFANALFDFLLPKSDDRLAAGFAMRRAILGDAHVDRSIANATDLTRDFQDLITRYAWGTIWTRPGLDPTVRRLLVLAMTASLGRWEEFRLHLRSGLAAGLELPDLEEVLLQVAIYAGVPAVNTAFQIASEK
jgi:3-oxoadipate enol-lactonase/4-carboxymuconolactone decarboxylase